MSNSVRFLEHFILNGPDPSGLEVVLAQLNDPKRQNPQELDEAVIGEDRSDLKAALRSLVITKSLRRPRENFKMTFSSDHNFTQFSSQRVIFSHNRKQLFSEKKL